jgi:hypothetical protein
MQAGTDRVAAAAAGGGGGGAGVVPLSLIPVGGGVAINSLKDWQALNIITNEWPYVNVEVLAIVVFSAVVSLVPIVAGRLRERFA